MIYDEQRPYFCAVIFSDLAFVSMKVSQYKLLFVRLRAGPMDWRLPLPSFSEENVRLPDCQTNERTGLIGIDSRDVDVEEG